MIDTYSARPIPTKIYFPQVDLEIRRRVIDMKNKPEYYAGRKITVYNKYLLIMSYTYSFYFEEALFNFFFVCKSFRNLLIKNFQVIKQNGVKVPTIKFDDFNYISDCFIKSSSDKRRYEIKLYLDVFQDFEEDYISDAIRLFYSPK